MKFISTRDKDATGLSFAQAMETGLAPDGGLYMPKEMPKIDVGSLVHLLDDRTALFTEVLAPFFAGDILAPHLREIVSKAFDFPLILNKQNDRYSILELFHGPTCAFKDFGARFLAACINKKNEIQANSNPMLILVATSGDTGGAVASAFYNMEGVRVGVLYPSKRVSLRQEKQLTVWGKNILSFEVAGSFDDCQAMLKRAFLDPRFLSFGVTSANSINIGRWLPQMLYFCWSSLEYHQSQGQKASYIIPTGNMGNVVAGLYAREMGFPIGNVTLACNQNGFVADYLKSGVQQPRPSVKTLANAMDVGNPSNVERLEYLYADRGPIGDQIQAIQASDSEIRASIEWAFKEWGEIICPHTATALFAARGLKTKDHYILTATAHAAKFNDIVEPIVGQEIPVPEQLQQLLKKPSQSIALDPSVDSLLAKL